MHTIFRLACLPSHFVAWRYYSSSWQLRRLEGSTRQVPTSPSSALRSSVLFAAQDRVQNAFLASVRADGARATNTQLSAGTLRNRRSGDPGCFLADAARRDSFPRSLAVPLVLSKAVSGILRSFPARRRTAVRRPGEPSGSELSLDLKGTPRFRGELPNTPLAGDARRTHQRTRYQCPDSFRPVSLFFCTSALAYYSLARAREGATQSQGSVPGRGVPARWPRMDASLVLRHSSGSGGNTMK